LNCWKLLIFINVLFLFFAEVGFSVENEASLFAKSIELYQRQDFAGSSSVLETLLKKNPANSLYWFNLGNCSYMTQRYENAAKYYRKNISLNSPLAPAAKLYLAKSLAQLGKRNEAIEILQKLKEERPKAGLLQEVDAELVALSESQDNADQALSYYQAARYDEAEALLKRKPSNERSSSEKLLLALVLIKQRKTSEAEVLLKNLSRDRGLSEEDKATVKSLLNSPSLVRSPGGGSSWLSLDLSYGFTNNAYLDGRSVEPLSSSINRFYLAGGHHFNQANVWSEKVNYFLSYENPAAAPELQTLTHTLEAGLFYVSAPLSSNLVPYVQSQSWDGQQVSTKLGLSSKNNYDLGIWDFGLDLEYATQAAASDSVSYLSGPSHAIRPYFGWRAAAVYAQVYWLEGAEGIQDIVYSDGSRLPLNQNYRGPGGRVFWNVRANSVVVFHLNSLRRTYRNVTLPEGKKRNDTETNVSLKYSYYMSPKVSVYGLVELSSNASSLETTDVRDKNYDNSSFTFGFNWDVF